MNIKRASPVIKAVLHLDALLAYLSIVVLIVVTLVCVIARYVLNSPLGWGEELQQICIVQVVFWGGSCVVRNGGLTRVDIVLDALPGKVRKVANILIDIVSFAIYIFIFVNGLKMVQTQLRIARPSIMLHVPIWLIYICIPISCVLMVLNTVLIRLWPSVFDETYDKEGNS